MNITNLPPNIMITVFSYLDKRDLINSVRPTCKVWHDLSYERGLWKSLHMHDFINLHFCTRTFIDMVSSACDSVEVLYMDLNLLDKRSVVHGEVICSNLKEIYLYWEYVQGSKGHRKDYVFHCHDGALLRQLLPDLSAKYENLKSLHLLSHVVFIKDLLPHFTQLEELEIEYADFSSEDADVVTETFFENHGSIKQLSIRFSVFNGKVLSFILSKVPGLKSLDLSNSNFNCDDIEMSEICQESLESLKLTNTRSNDRLLRRLVNKACQLELVAIGDCVELTNNGLDALAENCPNLKTLIINEVEYSTCNITDSGLQKVAELCPNIRVVKMVHCNEIGDLGLQVVSESCQDLRVLEATGCTAITDAAILCLIDNCPNISTLDLGYCVQLTSASINKVLRKCRNLKHLTLETCHRLADIQLDDENQNVQDHSQESNGAHFENGGTSADEIKLDITNDEVVTHSSIRDEDKQQANGCMAVDGNTEMNHHITNIAWHSHLRTLNLGFCSKISNQCVKQIAKHCPDLRNLNLQGCSMVTNAGVLAVVQGCQYLRKLNISGGSVFQTSRLTDDCLDHIAAHCDHLTKLTIIMNYHITTDGVFRVIKDCQNIEEISFASSRTSTTSGIKPESLTKAAGEVKGKTICIKIIGNNAKVSITKDVEHRLRKKLAFVTHE